MGGVPNPLRDERGCWQLREFQLMVAGVHELERQELFAQHETLGEGFDLDGDSVSDMHAIFHEYASDGNITVTNLQRCLSKFNVYPSAEEMKISLAATEPSNTLAFKDFLKVIVALCE